MRVVDVEPFAHVVAFGLLDQRPQVPAPAGEDLVGEEVACLALSGGVTQVVLEGGGRALAGHLRRAHGHRAEVGCHVRHARVLPVDEADVAVLIHQEVRGEEVVVRGDFIEAVRVRECFQAQDLVAQLKVSGHVNRAEGLQEALVAQAFGNEVEGAVQDSTGGVQGAVHLHSRFQFFGAGHVQVAHVAHETRELPSRRRVARDEGIVDAEFGGQAQAGELCAAVHDLFRADAGVAVDVLVVSDREVAREVRDALLERVEVADLRLCAAQSLDDVVEYLGVDVFDEQRIEVAHLVDRIELVDDAVGVAADHHVERLDVIQVDGLPQLRDCLGLVVDLFEDLAERCGEVAVEVDVAEHDPRVLAAHGRACDAVARAHLDAPLVGGTLNVVGRVVGLVDVGFEGVRREVVVRGTHVGVVQAFPHAPQ